MKNAIILCSGGLDSAVTSHYAKKKLNYGNLIILFINYRQRNLKGERSASKFCAKSLNAEFKEIKLKWLSEFSTSLLNRHDFAAKISRSQLKNTEKEGSKWYVPARNLAFFSVALSLAESLFVKSGKKYDIFFGFKNEGKEPYPDTTKSFIALLNQISKTSTKAKPKILSPLINKDKEDIVLLGKKLNVNLFKTFSCYASSSKIHCGKCLSCMLRKEGFYWANIINKTKYQN